MELLIQSDIIKPMGCRQLHYKNKEKKMDKQELLKLVDSLELPKEEYYILSSGCLLLYGLRKKAKDLDLCVSTELFEHMKVRFNIDLSSKNNCGFYCLNDKIEIVVNDKQEFNRDFKDGYPVESLQGFQTIR